MDPWAQLLSFRPPVEHGDGRVLISDPIRTKRAAIDIEAVVDLLAAARLGSTAENGRTAHLAERFRALGWLGPAAPTASARGVRHWWRRKWTQSLNYYLWTRRSPYADLADDSGETRRAVVRAFLNAEGPPPPRIALEGPRLILPPPRAPSQHATLGALLLARRTLRRFDDGSTASAVLSAVLHDGLSDVRERRTHPRDGLDYLRSYGIVFDPYLIVFRVDEVPAGVYRYELPDHVLVRVRDGELSQAVSRILLGMPAPRTAAWTVVLTADFVQYQWRYRHERALRNLYIAAGRIAQRLTLVALAHGLGTLPTPATRDRELSDLLRLDLDRQAPIYTLTMGRVRATAADSAKGKQ